VLLLASPSLEPAHVLLPPIVGRVANYYNGIIGIARGRRMSSNVNSLVLTAVALPVERVAIIGGGSTGLSLAHALLSSNIRDNFMLATPAATRRMDISIFELQLGFNYEISGSGIQLTRGMATLRWISRKLQQRASDAALPLGG
jgi:hypothetical protein